MPVAVRRFERPDGACCAEKLDGAVERFTQAVFKNFKAFVKDGSSVLVKNLKAFDGERTEGVQCRSDRVVNGCT